ncbi:response regulator transcription factor [Streptomyces sp. NPDC001288]
MGSAHASTEVLLTPRQTQVLGLASIGNSYYQIGRALGISENTVDVYMRQILRRLNAENLPHAVLLGCQAGILNGRPQRHGDHAGFMAHARRGEEACGLCKAAESVYKAGRRQARKRTS